MNKLAQLFKEKPYLAWYIKDTKDMSEQSMLEHILNYGDWDDYLTAEKVFGLNKTKSLYQELKNKKRVNLRNKTVNYFDLYFEKYA
jgi:hypothetical protein